MISRKQLLIVRKTEALYAQMMDLLPKRDGSSYNLYYTTRSDHAGRLLAHFGGNLRGNRSYGHETPMTVVTDWKLLNSLAEDVTADGIIDMGLAQEGGRVMVLTEGPPDNPLTELIEYHREGSRSVETVNSEGEGDVFKRTMLEFFAETVGLGVETRNGGRIESR